MHNIRSANLELLNHLSMFRAELDTLIYNKYCTSLEFSSSLKEYVSIIKKHSYLITFRNHVNFTCI